MAKLTSITVNFGRTVQPAQYESKKSDVTLTAVPDDEDSFLTEKDLDSLGELARNKALELVGIQIPGTANAAKQAYADKAATEPAVTAESVEKRKPGRPKKDESAVNPSPTFAPTVPLTAPVSASATADVDVTALADTTPKSSNDDIASELEAALSGATTPAAVVYTGPELNKLCDNRVRELREKGDAEAPKRIIALMTKYRRDPNAKQFAAICLDIASDPERTAAFVAEIKAL